MHASRKRPRAAFAEQHAQLPDDSGNPDVQEKLMNIIRVQIGQEKVKDFVKEESEKLRQAAEEVSLMAVWFRKTAGFRHCTGIASVSHLLTSHWADC